MPARMSYRQQQHRLVLIKRAVSTLSDRMPSKGLSRNGARMSRGPPESNSKPLSSSRYFVCTVYQFGILSGVRK